MDKEKLKQLAENVRKDGIKTRSGQIIMPGDLDFVVQKGQQGRADRYAQVGITGHSGGGKTTIAEFLARVLYGTGLEGDPVIFHGFADPRFEKQTMETFNIKDKNRLPKAGEDVTKFAYENYLPLDEEKERKIFTLMRPFVEEMLKIAYANPTMDFASHPILKDALLYQHKDENGKIIEPNFFTTEMCGYHQADTLKRRPDLKGDGLPTDFLTHILNDKDDRKGMLHKRGNMQPFVELGMFDDIVKIREKVQSGLLQGLDPDLYAYNEYDEASLVRVAQQIIKMMMSEGVVKLGKQKGTPKEDKSK